MSSPSDEALARILQAEFDEEYQGGGNVIVSTRNTSDFTPVSRYSSMPSGSSSSSNFKPLSLIDREWGLLDPTPDPRALFLQFNDRLFSGRLAGVKVRWSPMTLCAGVCSYEGRGGSCSIRFSVPLLKLRPRKVVVEILLGVVPKRKIMYTTSKR